MACAPNPRRHHRYCEEIPPEENEAQDTCTKTPEVKMDTSPQLPKISFTSNNLPSTGSSKTAGHYDVPPEPPSLPLPDNKLSKSTGPVPSPSLNVSDNEDLPTESETQDDEEYQAFLGKLNGKRYIDQVYKFSVDKLYDLLFTESQFMRDFHELRRFSDVVYQPWKKEELRDQSRKITYTITITELLVSKTATVNETQTLYKDSQVSKCYIVDAEVNTHDVLYHDHFYTVNRYILTRVAKNKCKLRVSTEVRYRKQTWVKDFIEKQVWSGLDDYFRNLDLELSKMEVDLKELHSLSSNAEEPSAVKHVPGSTQTLHLPDPSVRWTLALYGVILVMMFFLIMMHFYVLWSLEQAGQSLASLQGLRALDSMQHGTDTRDDGWTADEKLGPNRNIVQ